MKTPVQKLEFRLHDAAHYTDAHELAGVINRLIDKINELTQTINELNYEVDVLHEWKLTKEGI